MKNKTHMEISYAHVIFEKKKNALNSLFSLGDAHGVGFGEDISVSLTGGVGGSLSRICSGTRSLRVMRGGGT